MPMSEYMRALRVKIGSDLVLMPGVTAVIFNTQGEVLLQHNKDTALWNLPGGAMDPLEEPAAAIIREVQEESGLTVAVERLVGVYMEPVTRYPNGDLVQYMAFVFACHADSQQPVVNDDESLAMTFFPIDQLPTPMNEVERIYLLQALKHEIHADFRYGTQEKHA